MPTRIKKSDKFCGKCGIKIGDNIKNSSSYINKANSQTVAKVGVRVDSSYHYFIDDKGNVARERDGKKEIIAKVGVRMEKGYEYFINNRGDIARAKTIGDIGCNLDENIKSDSHIKLFQTNLNKLVSECGNGFIIFKLIRKSLFSKTSKDTPFVQFCQENDEITLDFPYESDCYKTNWGNELCKMLEKLNINYTKDSDSIRSRFKDLESASMITNEIFKCESDYKVDIEIALNG